MGITAREHQIIALDEAGMSPLQIAVQLGLSEAYVLVRIKNLCRGLGSDGGFAAMMAHGSKRLRSAILKLLPPANTAVTQPRAALSASFP